MANLSERKPGGFEDDENCLASAHFTVYPGFCSICLCNLSKGNVQKRIATLSTVEAPEHECFLLKFVWC
jgi:hypothetical protein